MNYTFQYFHLYVVPCATSVNWMLTITMQSELDKHLHMELVFLEHSPLGASHYAIMKLELYY